MDYLSVFIFAILLFSMIVGVIFVEIIKGTKLYKYIDQNTIFSDIKMYNFLGTNKVKLLIIKTPLRHFNKEIVILKRKYNKSEIESLRNKMTNAEIGHIIGFVFTLFACLLLYKLNQNKTSIIILMILNVIFNFYPILIQQSNKIRLKRILEKHT